MKNQIVCFEKETGKALIEENYILTCGLEKEKPALQKIRAHAMACLLQVLEQTEIRALVSSYDASCVEDGKLVVEGEQFSCPAVRAEMRGDILSVISFVVTVGEISLEDSRVLNQAYFDIGGTAMVDAARDLLQMWIRNQYESAYVSVPFGPGFYGMPASDVTKFFRFMDCGKIGIRLLPSGFMLPAKSCVGFYLVSEQEESLPVMDCAHCLGKGKMCNYCKAGRTLKR